MSKRDDQRWSALARECPNCQAKPGESCTQPDDRGRHPVRTIHSARMTNN